jgi:hypothetical protein
MPRPFSRTFSTFLEWLAAHPSSSPYAQRIVRGHARYPAATLGELRRHPASGQRPLSQVPRALPQRVSWRFLSPREREKRVRALEVLSEARKGEGSLSKLSRARGISPRTVRRATGAFRRTDGRWVANRSDRIERWLKTYERGARTEVLIADSRTASRLSRYAHAVSAYLETGDSRLLAKFRGKTYRDAHGKVHRFETRPGAIRAAVERSESDFGAFADLYVEPHETGDGA